MAHKTRVEPIGALGEGRIVPNYERPAFSGSLWKSETPRVLEKKEKRTKLESQDKAAKKIVRRRDPACRICLFRRSTEVHELVPKSKGGVASNFNSIGICGAANGGLCHSLIQQHAISYTFKQPARGADGPMVFTMNKSVADAVFGRRVVPKHVEVTE